MKQSDEAPWVAYRRKRPNQRPSDRTLERWRVEAKKLARARGARWACMLCKRPIGREAGRGGTKAEGCYGVFWLRVPGPWRVKPKKRKVCYSCWAYLNQLMQELEWQGNNHDLPPEILGETHGS